MCQKWKERCDVSKRELKVQWHSPQGSWVLDFSSTVNYSCQHSNSLNHWAWELVKWLAVTLPRVCSYAIDKPLLRLTSSSTGIATVALDNKMPLQTILQKFDGKNWIDVALLLLKCIRKQQQVSRRKHRYLLPENLWIRRLHKGVAISSTREL